MRLRVRGLETKNQELVEARRSTLTQPGNCILGLLNGILVFAPIRCERPIPFMRRVLAGEIYTHYSNANCLPASPFEFFSLPYQIADHPVDLFDHCLC